MSRLLDDDEDDLPQRDRELTLSTGAILAIFLGLVLLCGAFFGFGYNLGRKSTNVANTPLPTATTDAEAAATDNSTFNSFKPSPSTASANSPAASVSAPAPTPSSPPVTTTTPTTPATGTPPAPVVRPAPVTGAATATVESAPRSAPTNTATATHRPTSAAPTATPTGSFVVQIAAISASHKDDADLLANALRGKGYDVAERTEPDNLIHIQVGPFGTKADAEAMRERLIVDGYNAIVK